MKYDAAVAANYAKYRGVNPAVLQQLIGPAVITNRSSVLEVGCGTGNYCTALSAMTGCNCTGLDQSPEMLAVAGARCENVHFVEGMAESLPFPDRTFDLIFSVDVIHHVSDCRSCISEAFWVLKKGGWFCIVTDSEQTIRAREILSGCFPETIDIELSRYPKLGMLREIMSRVGFTGIREMQVALPYLVTDISSYCEKACSCLRLISGKAFQHGIRLLEEWLAASPEGIPVTDRSIMLWGRKPRL